MKQIGSFIQKNTATVAAKTVLFLALLLCAMTTPARAQTTWTGAIDTDWATPSNWSAGVPGAANDAIIPDVANDPIIGAAASAQSITVQSGAVLTIAAAVTLTINGFVTQGILNQGTVENSGTLNIGQNTSTGLYGIRNESVFNNSTGSHINIDRSTNTGLYNVNGGTFTNAGTITMGTIAANVATYGIVNESVFNNNTGGQINIDRRVNTGLYNFIGGTFTNAATITVGAVSQVPYGIRNESTFNNNTGGQISIDRWTNIGLNNVTGGTFTNVATISIGVVVVANGGDYGIRNESVFNNNTGGQINIDRSRIWGLYNFTGGTFINAATITIGAVASVGNYGIWNNAAFNNNTGGQIKIDRWTSNGLYNNTGGTFTNAATITIGALVASTGLYGISNNATFNNNTGGEINIDRSTDTGLYNFTGGTFTNETTITIGAVASVGTYGLQNNAAFNNNTGGEIKIDRSTSAGLYNLSGGTFTNETTITIGAVASVGTYGISNNAAFNNNTGGQINIDRSTSAGIYLLFGTSTFPNAATITIGALVPMTTLMTYNGGTFSNNTGGLLKGAGTLPAVGFIHAGGRLAPGYSPGKMTFAGAEDFSNSVLDIEVAGGGGVGGADFDQVVVTSGAATVGTNTTLNLVFSYAAAEGATFDILTAGSISGTIPPGNISFSNTGAGNVTSVSVSYPAGMVRVTVSTVSTWTGATSTDWATAANWSAGVPGAANHVIIPNVTNDPTIGTAAFARTVTVQNGAVLTIAAAGTLTIDGSPTQGILNQWRVENSGTLNIGQTTGTGLYGIQNNGAFNNNTGGQINIDRSTIAGLYNFNGGSFTNVASITIGAVAGVGTYGIQNNATFSNNTGGQINIDRATTSGILLNSGTFSNAATAIIGALVPITNVMTAGSGTFSNNTGGVLKGAGTLPAAAFTHAGGQLAPGYSPGKMTFDAAENFSNSILAMEVAGGGGVGGADFDQVVVTSGAAALGANTTLNLVFSYATTEGATFDILTATSINGTIPLANISFSNTGAGNVTSVIVSYPAGKVRVTVSTASTWTGATGTDWATATNWSNGVPDATKIAIIPNVTNDPTISSAAFARTVTVQSGAVLSIASAATLTIDGSPTQGILNQGTVENSGTLRIGQTISTGLYGIRNESIFNNNMGGQIRIDRTTGTNSIGIYNFIGGTFTNMAIITIGAAASVGTYGVQNNNATFNNNTGGQINIDRSTLYGLSNSGTFSNAASITIGGAAASVGTFGIYNTKTFNNNTGGQIQIDRSTSIGLYNLSAGNFTNVATITIGAGGSVGMYGIANEAVFNNNTGGQIQIDRSTSIGLYNLNAGNFTNVATITIGAVASVGQHGIHNNATFNNNTGGQIKIDRATTSGILVNAGSFSNAATTTIGALVPVTNLMTPGSGTFSNNTGGVLKGAGTLPAAAFTHAGGELAPGYSPGKMTFNDAEDFSNSILTMELAGGGGVGGADFDQVVVTGAATLGTNTTLNLVFGYAAVEGATFDILTATSISGTIPPDNISFSNTGAGNVTGVSVSYLTGIVRVTVSPALPVEMVRFSAKEVDGQIVLHWQTASEWNNKGFKIERSADGTNWDEIGFVEGNGTTTEMHEYSFLDQSPLPAINYYRLRQLDLDGKVDFSSIIKVWMPGGAPAFSVFPNPVSQGELILRFSEKSGAEEVIVRLFDAAGQLVKSHTFNTENDQRIDVSGLPPGAYMLESIHGRLRFCEKVIID